MSKIQRFPDRRDQAHTRMAIQVNKMSVTELRRRRDAINRELAEIDKTRTAVEAELLRRARDTLDG